MKTILSRPLFYCLLILLGSLAFFSCKKSDSQTPASPYVFNCNWLYNGVVITTNYDTAYEYIGNPPSSQYYIIINTRSGVLFPVGPKFYFALSSLNMGTYTIQPNPALPNNLQFIDDAGFNLIGISGTLHISARTGYLITGDFSITLLDGSGNTHPVSGYFTNMTVVH